MAVRLLERYRKEIVPAIQSKFSVKNPMEVPRLQKVVLNMGVGEAISDMKILETCVSELSMITGQKPIITRSTKAISNFKLKANQAVGCKVTLRRARMYEFLDRFFNVAIPRIRDFNGMSRKAFDKKGNYSIGIVDQAIFPEIDTGKSLRTQGMDITFVFDHGPKEHTLEVLRLLGMPFTKEKEKN